MGTTMHLLRLQHVHHRQAMHYEESLTPAGSIDRTQRSSMAMPMHLQVHIIIHRWVVNCERIMSEVWSCLPLFRHWSSQQQSGNNSNHQSTNSLEEMSLSFMKVSSVKTTVTGNEHPHQQQQQNGTKKRYKSVSQKDFSRCHCRDRRMRLSRQDFLRRPLDKYFRWTFSFWVTENSHGEVGQESRRTTRFALCTGWVTVAPLRADLSWKRLELFEWSRKLLFVGSWDNHRLSSDDQRRTACSHRRQCWSNGKHERSVLFTRRYCSSFV